MPKFKEGQQVEALRATGTGSDLSVWEPARIDRLNCVAITTGLTRTEKWHVIFRDGTRSIRTVDHIKEIINA